ncbi:hypothetical protein WMF28_30395 [Sorangium sp. So ce590]|uniref:hypothetical protein n=1 Tax=Sorangium sp. So ce590 TaxID=3133317 RepID=UPI003F636AB8
MFPNDEAAVCATPGDERPRHGDQEVFKLADRRGRQIGIDIQYVSAHNGLILRFFPAWVVMSAGISVIGSIFPPTLSFGRLGQL